jgi:polysaccharide biosynthesis/export protein
MLPLFRLLLICLLVAFISSCTSKKKVLYLQDYTIYKDKQIEQEYTAKLQPDDVLSIVVSSADNVGVTPFNVIVPISMVASDRAVGQPRMVNYIIRQDGTIEFPVLGKVTLAGLTTLEAIEYMKELLKPYLNEPIVIMEWLNYKFTVLGEVKNPGVYRMTSERVNIFEALGMAGDLDIYGSRKDIMLIRENNGKQSTYKLDLRSKDFIDSEVFYIKQNDVIIVSPNRAQIQSSAFNRNTPLYVSMASLILSVIVVITR